jgi:hypothetical protein
VLGGLWHGATWMFIIWGAMHGCALAIHRLWKGSHRSLPPLLAWILTFTFVNFAWVFFRAKTMNDALRVLRGMFDIPSIFEETITLIPTSELAWGGWLSDELLKVLPNNIVGQLPIYLAISGALFLTFQRNSSENLIGFIGNLKITYSAFLFSIAMYFMLSATSTVFLYFNF